MQDIINKLKDLASELSVKIADNEAKAKELALELRLAKESATKNSAKEDELSIREKKVSNVEDVVRLSEENKANLVAISRMKADNVKVLEQIASDRKALESKDAELKNMIALYRIKNENLEAEKVQLAKDRVEMRAKILEDLKKLK